MVGRDQLMALRKCRKGPPFGGPFAFLGCVKGNDVGIVTRSALEQRFRLSPWRLLALDCAFRPYDA
jgi:hypothetical protein